MKPNARADGIIRMDNSEEIKKAMAARFGEVVAACLSLLWRSFDSLRFERPTDRYHESLA